MDDVFVPVAFGYRTPVEIYDADTGEWTEYKYGTQFLNIVR